MRWCSTVRRVHSRWSSLSVVEDGSHPLVSLVGAKSTSYAMQVMLRSLCVSCGMKMVIAVDMVSMSVALAVADSDGLM